LSKNVITILIVAVAALVVAASFLSQPTSQSNPATTTPPAATAPASPEAGSPDAELSDSAEQVDAAAAVVDAVEEAVNDVATSVAGSVDEASPNTDVAAEVAVAAPADGFASLGALSVAPAESSTSLTLGSLDLESGYRAKVELFRWGAGVERITLASHSKYVIDPDDHYVVLETLTATDPRFGSNDPRQSVSVRPYAARFVRINDSPAVNLQAVAWNNEPLETSATQSTAKYHVTLVDEAGTPVARVERAFTLTHDSYEVQVAQRVVNLTAQPLRVVWEQNGQGDLVLDPSSYIGDQRKFVTGYFRPSYDQRRKVWTDDAFKQRIEVVDRVITDQDKGRPPFSVWPNASVPGGSELAWVATENRYFAAVTYPAVPQGLTDTTQLAPLDSLFPRLGLSVFPSFAVAPNYSVDQRAAVITLGTAPQTIVGNGSLGLGFAFYAGPRNSEQFNKSPFMQMGFVELIRYELGCTWCTFQWLAHGLLSFLKLIFGFAGDWGIAIIVLVIVVRLILHPITKKAQANMLKMGKQMQHLQPQMEKLKKKYKDDPKKLQSETMALYRESGINPLNALGCLPMFLQMPIWVALYAMLYFAIELRHEPAFYGVFQMISGGGWHFLQDLSRPDNFIRFVPIGEPGFKLTWLPFIEPEFAAINILPILMAVGFFIQKKPMSPPPAHQQQTQQQKNKRWGFLPFPVFLYSAPRGGTL